MGSTLLTPLYVLYRSSYGFSAFVLVLVYAIYVVGNLLALFFFGQLSDRIGLIFAIVIAAIAGLAWIAAFVCDPRRSHQRHRSEPRLDRDG